MNLKLSIPDGPEHDIIDGKLKWMGSRINAGTPEVIRRALAIYEEILRCEEEGMAIFVEGNGKRERLVTEPPAATEGGGLE